VSQHPTLFEELNRKSVDALVWLAEGEESGSLSPDQVYVARQALFMALSGLVEREIGQMLSSAPPMTDLGQQAVFWRDDSMIVLTLNKDNRVTSNAVRFDPLSVVLKSIANSTRSSTEVFIGAKSGLINHGYKQVD
jgi:hypothetical protein